MRTSSHRVLAVALAAAAIGTSAGAAAAQAGRTVQPGAPGDTSRVVSAGEAAAAQPGHSAADVRFMQGMIPHHAQAVEMTALVPSRTARADIQLLARRIERAQADEMELMRRWLQERGEEVPDEHAHHAGHGAHAAQGHPAAGADAHALMPGMLAPAEMARLAAASGAEFDRLFLEYMIRHHEGALVMVAELFASEGGGQDGEIFQFAAHVDGDQRIEISRMHRMLSAGS
jgi:uncharacterized protein (DUF305 family)